MKNAICPKCETETEDANKSTWARDLLTRKKICAMCEDEQRLESACLEHDYMRFEAPKTVADAYFARKAAKTVAVVPAPKPVVKAPPAPLMFETPRDAVDFCDKYQIQPVGFVQDTGTGKWVILVDVNPLIANPAVYCDDGTLKAVNTTLIQFDISDG